MAKPENRAGHASGGHGQVGGHGYTGMAKTLHWLVVALLIVQFIIAWTMPEIRRNTRPDTLINLHLSFGMVILLVAALRLAWRLIQGEAKVPECLTPWERVVSRITHGLLYFLLFAVPILGWINASWRGFPVVFFDLFDFPKIMATRAPGWGWTGDVHSLLANYVMLALVGLHVAAALYHYFIRRDRILLRMLPGG